MIIVDIETSGVNPNKNGMLSIGAVDLDSNQEFYLECQLTEGREVEPIALEINGFTLENIRHENKLTDTEALLTFCRWTERFKDKMLGGHNIGHLDILFLEEIWSRIDSGFLGGIKPKFPFSYRTVDLHSISYAEFGESLTHPQICEALGLTPEPKPHNALEGAKSEAAAFRLLLGKY